MHHRVQPQRHRFIYSVFSLCLDIDEIDQLDTTLKLFSRNRWNALSFFDRDYGARDGERVGESVRRVLSEAGLGAFGARIRLLCYPRMFGYVFNPLSVYFCYDNALRLGVMAYEVSNTFGERQIYVIPVDPAGIADNAAVVVQNCSKGMYVSPYTAAQGRYRFRIGLPDQAVSINVRFTGTDGAVLDTCFRGAKRALNDRAIADVLLRYPLMTVKIIAAIHVEAARLWWKGVPLVKRHVSPRHVVSLIKPATRDVHHGEH